MLGGGLQSGGSHRVIPSPEREVSTTGSENTHYSAKVCDVDNSPWSHASTTVDICHASADMNAEGAAVLRRCRFIASVSSSSHDCFIANPFLCAVH